MSPQPSASDVAAVIPADEPAVVTALRAALTSGDAARLSQILTDPQSALVRWIDGRIDRHLAGTAAVSRWDVALTPLYTSARDVAQLRLVAHLAVGTSEEFVSAVRLQAGNRLLPVGPVSALSLPITGHTLQVRLDPLQGTLAVTDTIACKPQTGRSYLLKLAPPCRP
jgi:hypothetical protein